MLKISSAVTVCVDCILDVIIVSSLQKRTSGILIILLSATLSYHIFSNKEVSQFLITVFSVNNNLFLVNLEI